MATYNSTFYNKQQAALNSPSSLINNKDNGSEIRMFTFTISGVQIANSNTLNIYTLKPGEQICNMLCGVHGESLGTAVNFDLGTVTNPTLYAEGLALGGTGKRSASVMASQNIPFPIETAGRVDSPTDVIATISGVTSGASSATVYVTLAVYV